jgi:hypothetical protein
MIDTVPREMYSLDLSLFPQSRTMRKENTVSVAVNERFEGFHLPLQHWCNVNKDTNDITEPIPDMKPA